MNGNRFKLIRLWQGLTIRDMGSALNVSSSTLSAVEQGHRHATAELRAAYARTFPLDETYYIFLSSYRKLDEDNHNNIISQV